MELEIDNNHSNDTASLAKWLCCMPPDVGSLYYYGITEVENFDYMYRRAALDDAEGRN